MPSGTPFVRWQGPIHLEGFRRGLEHSAHPATIPQTFVDAMEVREQVFVREQGVPIEYEFDEDDARSCHWVSYASVNTVVEPGEMNEDTGDVVHRRRSETRTVPIGTVRMVPFPHSLHPRRGGVYVGNKLVRIDPVLAREREPGDTTAPEEADIHRPVATQLYDGGEPYLQLGRLAVAKEFRGLHVARLLVRAALSWAQQNPDFFDPSIKKSGLENLGAEDPKQVPRWNGLLCVHSQKAIAPIWARCGFQTDERIGEWKEDEILHAGMFLRVDVGRKPSIP